jgi:hypothetical protein
VGGPRHCVLSLESSLLCRHESAVNQLLINCLPLPLLYLDCLRRSDYLLLWNLHFPLPHLQWLPQIAGNRMIPMTATLTSPRPTYRSRIYLRLHSRYIRATAQETIFPYCTWMEISILVCWVRVLVISVFHILPDVLT